MAVEELGLGQPFSLMADQMLENAQFATRKRPASGRRSRGPGRRGKRGSGWLPLRPTAAAGSPANNRGADEDLANMNRDVDDIVDAGLEQFDGVLKLLQVVEGDDRRPRPVANASSECWYGPSSHPGEMRRSPSRRCRRRIPASREIPSTRSRSKRRPRGQTRLHSRVLRSSLSSMTTNM